MITHDRDKPPSVPTVLVIEPYEDLRDGIVTTLQRRDYLCHTVDTRAAAALMLRKNDYAYVVVDADVPELTSELVSLLSPQSSVILITEDEASESEHVLRKPFGRDELLAQFVRPSGVSG